MISVELIEQIIQWLFGVVIGAISFVIITTTRSKVGVDPRHGALTFIESVVRFINETVKKPMMRGGKITADKKAELKKLAIEMIMEKIPHKYKKELKKLDLNIEIESAVNKVKEDLKK